MADKQINPLIAAFDSMDYDARRAEAANIPLPLWLELPVDFQQSLLAAAQERAKWRRIAAWRSANPAAALASRRAKASTPEAKKKRNDQQRASRAAKKKVEQLA